MRNWWKRVGGVAGCLLGLGGMWTAAAAQAPAPVAPPGGVPPGGGMVAPPPGGMPPMPGGAFGPPGGAFVPPGMYGPPPGPPQPAQDSPFTIRDDGAPNAFSGNNGADPGNPHWIVLRGEYLNWHISKGHLNVPTVTTTNNQAEEFGAIGQPGTRILAGPGDYSYGALDGWRGTIGLAPFHYIPPLEVTGFSFNRNLGLFQGGSRDATGPFLARPVELGTAPIAPGEGTNDVEFINVPGVAAGTMEMYSRLSFWNLETNFVLPCCAGDGASIDFLLGYRHTDLQETLDMVNTLGPIGQPFFGGSAFQQGFVTRAQDIFRTRSQFDGGQVGLRAALYGGRFAFTTDMKFAVGNTNSALNIYGSSELRNNVNGRLVGQQFGGILTGVSNSGLTTQNDLSIITEINPTLSLQLHPCIRCFAGYNIFYWSTVARAGTHMSNIVDPRQIPTDAAFTPNSRATVPQRPGITTEGFFAHGVNVGLEIGF